MDGVLCNSEEPSRRAAVDLFAEIGVSVTVDDFVPFTGTGEANFLGGVAKAKGINDFDTDAAKKRFFQIYLDKYAKPESGFGFPGALELCKKKGLKVAVASSADRVKLDANLAAAGLPSSLFDAIISADAFENLKPAPDIFLAASASLNVPPSEVKKLDLLSKKVVTIAGTGSAGFRDAPVLSAQLSEPSGIIEVGDGKLLIADTNNNAIRYLDLNSENVELHTFEVKGVPLPSPKSKSLKRLRRRLSSDTGHQNRRQLLHGRKFIPYDICARGIPLIQGLLLQG